MKKQVTAVYTSLIVQRNMFVIVHTETAQHAPPKYIFVSLQVYNILPLLRIKEKEQG